MKITHKEMLLEILKKHNKCEVLVGGTSMWPFIKDGDVVSIKYKPFKPSPGIVVAFFSGEQLIIHRIVWCREKSDDKWDIWVHGDGSPYSMSKIKQGQIIGAIEYVKREDKIVTLSLNDLYRIVAVPLGYIIQFLIACKLVLQHKEKGFQSSIG